MNQQLWKRWWAPCASTGSVYNFCGEPLKPCYVWSRVSSIFTGSPPRKHLSLWNLTPVYARPPILLETTHLAGDHVTQATPLYKRDRATFLCICSQGRNRSQQITVKLWTLLKPALNFNFSIGMNLLNHMIQQIMQFEPAYLSHWILDDDWWHCSHQLLCESVYLWP